jgi:hydrogenase maturation protein HypF
VTAGAVRAVVAVDGVVQGVGFRPFVARTASEYGLAGWVRNESDAGVTVVLEGDPDAVEAAVTTLRTDAPPLARIDRFDVDRRSSEGLDDFEIRRSSEGRDGTGAIPPDTGICDECLADVRDPQSRYHRYWATSCVDCGPRYTVVEELPYDRERTAMDAFPLCDACREAYEDPTDRRYHAQTIACSDCGPTVTCLDGAGDRLATGHDAVRRAAESIGTGAVAAVKGTGGAHLVCDATDPQVVGRLRDAVDRPAKPFAVMVPDVETAAGFATLSERERAALSTVRRPIVLLEHERDRPWLDAVAPRLHTVGVMLPYAGLHHLLFDALDRPLVVTSANRPGRPMCTTTGEIRDRLGDAVDVVLGHDRRIVTRCDDSVVRVVDGQRRFVRRSRGWVPERLGRPSVSDGESRPSVLALGPERDLTVAVARDDAVVPSQYVGDVDGPATRAYLERTVDHLLGLTDARPAVVARDMHPDFETTRLAEAYASGDAGPDRLDGVSTAVPVQHHHAHAASLLGEHERDRAVVVVSDGTGYGPDGTIWGGEVLDTTLASFDRVGGLDAFPLPGGEAAVRRPGRTLAGLLADPDRIDRVLVDRGAVDDRSAAAAVRRQVDRGVNAPRTTSTGRVLDAVSALLGVCTRRRYEGEPAMRLESVAARGTPLECEVPYGTRGDARVVDVRALVQRLADWHAEGTHPRAALAATAQRALATGLAEIAVEAAVEREVGAVGFTGGVAYNEAMAAAVRERVDRAGLVFLGNRQVPPGDGGISYGQALVADARVADAPG